MDDIKRYPREAVIANMFLSQANESIVLGDLTRATSNLKFATKCNATAEDVANVKNKIKMAEAKQSLNKAKQHLSNEDFFETKKYLMEAETFGLLTEVCLELEEQLSLTEEAKIYFHMTHQNVIKRDTASVHKNFDQLENALRNLDKTKLSSTFLRQINELRKDVDQLTNADKFTLLAIDNMNKGLFTEAKQYLSRAKEHDLSFHIALDIDNQIKCAQLISKAEEHVSKGNFLLAQCIIEHAEILFNYPREEAIKYQKIIEDLQIIQGQISKDHTPNNDIANRDQADYCQKVANTAQLAKLMNSNPGSGFGCRDDGGRGRGKRGGQDCRGQNSGGFMDSNRWKTTSSGSKYTVDTSKLKAPTPKNNAYIKLAPTNTGWNYGFGTKNTAPARIGATSNSMKSHCKNIYCALENVPNDPATLRGKWYPPLQAVATPVPEATPAPLQAVPTPVPEATPAPLQAVPEATPAPLQAVPEATPAPLQAVPTPVPEATPAPLQAVPEATPAPLQAVPQERLPEAKKKYLKSMIDLSLINPDDEEMVAEVKHQFQPQYHADLVTEILNVALEKTAKNVPRISKSLLHLVSTNTISADNFLAGMKEIFEYASDLYIDIPLLYDYLGKLVAPHVEKKHITLVQILRISETIISANQGQLILKAVLKELKEEMGPSFVKSKWQQSGLKLTEWMCENQVSKWIEENKFEFLEDGA